ncbi:pentapeptide repeat-containing protein [Xanthomonas albilineans]|uniref:pentapeptide repeat-containing protein n=1 Tax=Xanthomonas albilineans TaxID=29447 RepID=UPI0005F3491E|nr:pentapeptide repeat-containing protein [Xanthomonas albilineans]
MKFEIKDRWTGNVLYICELSAEVAEKSYGMQLGFAINSAVSSRANLIGADLIGANLRSANLIGADLRGADLRSADLRRCPVVINNIHSAVYAAASQPMALEMGDWHTCDTTHCRAGWVVTLAGDGGRALEYAYGTSTAAALIYMSSDPQLEHIPDFYCGNDKALEDMRRLAEAEAVA